MISTYIDSSKPKNGNYVNRTMWNIAALSGLSLLVCASHARAAEKENGWDGHLFDYKRPAKLVVEQSTPTEAQVAFLTRPPQLAADTPDPVATPPAAPKVVGPVNVVEIRFKDTVGEIVPVLLCTPRDKKGPFPLVIATHGLLSNKAQVCGQVAWALAEQGYATLAADMPCHGERPGDLLKMSDAGSRQTRFPLYQQAVVDVRQLMDLAEQLPQIDAKAGIRLVGYSMGSWISSTAGPADPRVKAIVLMVGGAFDIPEAALKDPKVSACDPRISLQHFTDKPVLFLNGKTDGIVAPEHSKRLFAACPEPKKQIWYDSGHFLPREACTDAAKWLAEMDSKKP